jgi:hypothetical protein
MNILLSLIKEILESIYRNYLKKGCFIQSLNNERVNEIRSKGLTVIPDFYGKEKCAQLRSRIDNFICSENANIWIDDEGADARLYFIEEPEIRKYLKLYTGISNPVGMVLAARINHTDRNQGSGGGWHRDSPVTHQFKAICYLSNVTTSNGPFQYIEGSHHKFNVIKNFMNRVFIPGQYRFSEAEVEKYLQMNEKNKIVEFVAEQGTLAFADTKGIHRGKPLHSGERYAIFCYFWEKTIPPHFEKLRQTSASDCKLK